jgi:uncharacterized protein
LLNGFLIGLPFSLHCVGMCGPIAACFLGKKSAVASYHLARFLSYTLAGLLVGGLGHLLGIQDLTGQGAWISFALAGLLVLFALGLDKKLGSIPGVGGLFGKAMNRAGLLSPSRRAALIGLLTPLLPCGALFAIYGTALLYGSTLDGGLAMAGFALGTLPLLAFAQVQLAWLHQNLGPRGMFWAQRAALLLAAGVLVWRGTLDLGGASCCTTG